MVVGAVHAGLWLWMQDQRTAADFYGKLPSLSYTAFEGKKRERGDGYAPTVEQLRADMRALAPVTRAVRTYTSTEGSDLVPGAAAEFGLKVTVGAWLDSNPERNSRELESVIALARTHANVNGIYVGNELNVRADVPLLRGETLTERKRPRSPRRKRRRSSASPSTA
jgi:Exo-beta-1,3-glucanase